MQVVDDVDVRTGPTDGWVFHFGQQGPTNLVKIESMTNNNKLC